MWKYVPFRSRSNLHVSLLTVCSVSRLVQGRNEYFLGPLGQLNSQTKQRTTLCNSRLFLLTFHGTQHLSNASRETWQPTRWCTYENRCVMTDRAPTQSQRLDSK